MCCFRSFPFDPLTSAVSPAIGTQSWCPILVPNPGGFSVGPLDHCNKGEAWAGELFPEFDALFFRFLL